MTKLGKLKTLTIASLSAVALAAPIAYAQSTGSTQDNQQVTRGERRGGHDKTGKGWGRKGRGHHRMHGGMFRGIELTEDQKTRMKQISDSFRQRTQVTTSGASIQASGLASGKRGRYVQRSISHSEADGNGCFAGEINGRAV